MYAGYLEVKIHDFYNLCNLFQMERGKLKAKYYQQENLILYFNYSVNLNLFKIKKKGGEMKQLLEFLKGEGKLLQPFVPKFQEYIFFKYFSERFSVNFKLHINL